MLTRTTRELFLSLLREYSAQASVHGVGYVVSARLLADRLLWLSLVVVALISASLLSHDLYLNWQKAPVVTDLKDTNKQVQDLQFPSVTICTEGINMEAVLDSLNQDFSDWLLRNGFTEDREPNMETALNRFRLETFSLRPSEDINLQDIVLAFTSSNPDEALFISSITDTMISCKEHEECEEEDHQHQGCCYKVIETELSWSEANQTCAGYQGYSLASVHNKYERNFVANLTASRAWLGARWTSNSTIPSWSDGQEDPAGCTAHPDIQLNLQADSDQALVVNSESPGSWTRLPTSPAMAFICKKGQWK